jgi:pimeloyl-ACP methyl ester carboxylesterase
MSFKENLMKKAFLLWSLAIALGGCSQSFVPNLAIADPRVDATHPPSNFPFTIPVGAGAVNAMLYTAAGDGPHPTVLLLHGFPGNEQNLDLAQAARRAGWNVLTMHYRGTWGSAGGFSFAGAAEDAHAALKFLRDPGAVQQFRVDPTRVAIVGHSMGGFLAADAAADDPSVIGLFLIDPWDMAAEAKAIETPAGAKAWHEEMVADQPALSGTDEATLATELRNSVARFDLANRVSAYGSRPLDIISANRGNGPDNAVILKAVQRSTNPSATGETWQTDHSFNDRRIALAERLVRWLGTLPKHNDET